VFGQCANKCKRVPQIFGLRHYQAVNPHIQIQALIHGLPLRA
jgi:hypothetical protein